ncbi:MAG: hypothetical protein ABL890_00440 [Candidatus Peribacteraceae bacterium]
MKNHLGVVVGISMLAIAGVVVSQMPTNETTLRGEIGDSACAHDLCWDSILNICSMCPSSIYSSSLSSAISCEDKKTTAKGAGWGLWYCANNHYSESCKDKATEVAIENAGNDCAPKIKTPKPCDVGCTGIDLVASYEVTSKICTKVKDIDQAGNNRTGARCNVEILCTMTRACTPDAAGMGGASDL